MGMSEKYIQISDNIGVRLSCPGASAMPDAGRRVDGPLPKAPSPFAADCLPNGLFLGGVDGGSTATGRQLRAT